MEQVDQFVEDYFDGSIITPLARHDIQTSSFHAQMLTTKVKNPQGQDVSPLDLLKGLESRASEYARRRDNPATASSAETGELAILIFDGVLALRDAGLLQNSPDNPKILEFYKTRSKQLEEQNTKHRRELKDAYQIIQQLETRLGEKAKGSKVIG